MVESIVLAESGFRTDGAQECLGNWGEAKLVSDFSALGQAKVDLSLFSFGSSWLMRLIHADLRTGQLITCWDED